MSDEPELIKRAREALLKLSSIAAGEDLEVAEDLRIIIEAGLAAAPRAGVGQSHDQLRVALDAAITVLVNVGLGYRQSDEEDDWYECPSCHAWRDYYGHRETCALVDALNKCRAAEPLVEALAAPPAVPDPHAELVEAREPIVSDIPAWRRVIDLFAKHGLPAPPVALRDELVTHLAVHDQFGGYRP